MQRKDYETIAKAIRNIPCDRAVLEIIIARCIQALKEDNPNFDPVKFRKACLEDNR